MDALVWQSIIKLAILNVSVHLITVRSNVPLLTEQLWPRSKGDWGSNFNESKNERPYSCNWGQEVIYEVAEAKFLFSSTFLKLQKMFPFIFGFDEIWTSIVLWPETADGAQVIFEIRANERKRWAIFRLSSQNFH